MSDFIAEALQMVPAEAPDWLSEQRRRGWSSWKSSSMPTRKTEDWKYTRLRALEEGAYLDRAECQDPSSPALTALRDQIHITGLDARMLVFVNGFYSPELSSGEVVGNMEVVLFSEADETQVETIRSHLGTVADRDKYMFTALNDSWLNDGVFVHVKQDRKVTTPLHVIWLTVPQREAFSLSQRLLVVMEAGSEATVVEHFASNEAQQNSFTNGVSELVLAANARLCHYRLHLEEEHALHIGGVHARLDRDARLNSFHLGLGSILKRLDVVVRHEGEGAHCDLNGIYLPRHSQHIDYHTCIEHVRPHCTTKEVFRGIISDNARAVFNGRIHIHPDAQKTVAELRNKNLLTSNKAEVDTKPELEIYADDVKCAHGATVAQLDDYALYYLCSRGIAREHAQVMLSTGFINELINNLQHPSLGEYLKPVLGGLFAQQVTQTERAE
ncbi:Fe-S cluster assembly protein SufD [uncultured Porticoccus sp.]|uniref:Fe-S cluster assembly protein SufD n=1 Tax=uncultured Porticoccus sp. TaxID=1256050 RepID=UPI00262635A7|nr:Fe-S cluster assembly protein SufD [uncultured Porticoccus sp.]